MSRLGSGEMFDSIATRYDVLNRIMSMGIDRHWRNAAANALADVTGPIRVLDLATGTGDLAFAIADKRGNQQLGCIVGTDPSPNMLDVARRKLVARHDAAPIGFSVGDAQALPFADQSFDAITMAFGIRNVPDRGKALREMQRVLRRGGKLVILELSEPPPGLLGSAARLHVHHVVPRLGALLSGSREYRYLQQSIAGFPPAQDFCRELADAGFVVEKCVSLTLGTCHLYVARVPGGAM